MAGQAVALAGQHQHLFGRGAAGDLRGHPGGGLRAFAHALGFFGLVAGFGEAVAPGQRVAGGALAIVVRIGDGGQAQQLACVFRFRWCGRESRWSLLRLGLAHDGVDGGNHALRVAARVVAARAGRRPAHRAQRPARR